MLYSIVIIVYLCVYDARIYIIFKTANFFATFLMEKMKFFRIAVGLSHGMWC